ncbi:MAG: diguanylate cyclase [Alphaproteobacteria bacterium]|nr:diguanylate cyclase [Alphaproteobacteria bacterium]
MKILVIDRDTLSTQLVKSRLEAMGHTVVEEPVKNNAIARLEREDFDAVFFDPAPLNNARPVVLSIRRSVRNYPYVVLMSQDIDRAEALKSGANEIMVKPLDGSDLERMVKNAQRLTALIRRVGDESEDFPSAGGVISKSAFNQLFLSCIDRADRYGERSFLVFIEIANYTDLLNVDGKYAAEYAVAKLSQYLVRLRRQSDIIAQTGRGEFCLMLQRPMYETEPMEAANRFGEALNKFADVVPSESATVDIAVTLLDLPIGALHVEHKISLVKKTAQSVG